MDNNDFRNELIEKIESSMKYKYENYSIEELEKIEKEIDNL